MSRVATIKVGAGFKDIVATAGWEAWLAKNETKLVRFAQQEAPVDTGNLRRNIRTIRRPGRKLLLVADTEYAQYVIKGHGEIRPVNAKVLRFTTKAGVVVFTKKVRAVPPNDFLDRAVKRLGLKTRS